MSERFCLGCQKPLPVSQFYLRRTGKRSGKPYEKCKECMKTRGRNYYYLNRDRQLPLAILRRRRSFAIKKAYIDNVKNRSCGDCGNKFPLCAMDFDHRDKEKKLGNIAHMRIKNWSLEKIKAEIEKCDIVCANCHRVRTYNRQYAEVVKVVTTLV